MNTIPHADLIAGLADLPALYSTEDVPANEKIIVAAYYNGTGCRWLVCEYSPEEQIFFGHARLNNDEQNAEWGYISLMEFFTVNEMDCDEYCKIRRVPDWLPCSFPLALRLLP